MESTGLELSDPQPSPPRPRASRWDSKRVALVMLSMSALTVLVVMAGWDIHFDLGWRPPFLDIDIRHGPDLFAANTPTGGDMGAHVYVPAYLRDTLLPQGRIMGWSNDWYAGFPILYFYFPLPALTIVILDVFLPYGVAFKLVTIAGLVALPFASYFMARCMGFPRAVATIAGVAGGTFVFMESHTIYGGNSPATLAGEYSFSWSFALGMVYLGLVIRSTRENRGFTPLAAVVLALTALSHLVTTMVIVAISLPLLLRKRSAAPVLGSYMIGFFLAGFWAVPLLARVQGYTTDMNWQPVRGWDKLFPREMMAILVLGIIGMVWGYLRKYDVSTLFWMAGVPVAGYFLINYFNYTKLYNARLLPYWYYSMYFAAGIAVGLVLVQLARRLSSRDRLLRMGTVVASVFFLLVALSGMSFLGGWARWNYSGYEGKADWPEYRDLLQEVSQLPPGRVMWEANSGMNKYGTPMSLMLLPYWTEGSHPSMEGLLFESSVTTPFHFLNASEVSYKPSNPIRNLSYNNFRFDRALEHLPLYNVDYYVAFTEEATDAADARLERLVESPPFTVYALPDSELVEVATKVPFVYEGDDFFEASLRWYNHVDNLEQWMVTDGPDDWPRVDDEHPFLTEADYSLEQTITTSGTVSDIVLEDHRIAFKTTALNVPHLVKVSDFPNWTATGAEGPYKASPSLMVVIPTQENVEITFDYTAPELGGFLLTGAGVGFLGMLYVAKRRRRRIPVPATVAAAPAAVIESVASTAPAPAVEPDPSATPALPKEP